MPYGMPGLPIFLTLTVVRSLKAIPVVVIGSGCLAVMTWVDPPFGLDYYAYLNSLMAIYHIGMLGLALSLACLSNDEKDAQMIAIGDWIKQRMQQAVAKQK
jgi:hypothetical protein